MTNVIKEVIQTAIRSYECDDCKKTIQKASQYNYLYGFVHKGNTPYGLRICQNCKPIVS